MCKIKPVHRQNMGLTICNNCGQLLFPGNTFLITPDKVLCYECFDPDIHDIYMVMEFGNWITEDGITLPDGTISAIGRSYHHHGYYAMVSPDIYLFCPSEMERLGFSLDEMYYRFTLSRHQISNTRIYIKNYRPCIDGHPVVTTTIQFDILHWLPNNKGYLLIEPYPKEKGDILWKKYQQLSPAKDDLI